MLLDDVNHALIESVFQSEINAFLHMRDDDQRAHRRREIIVRIAFKAHVLSEVFRLYQFAHVMKISTDAAKRGEPAAETSTDQLAAPSHLQCKGNCCKPADQTCYQQGRVNRTKQDAAP